MDNPECGYPGVCGKTCGNDPCERCIRYDTKDKNGETITISKCFRDWEGECKEKSCQGVQGYCSNCETCLNGKCIPKKDVDKLICNDNYYCRMYDCNFQGEDGLCDKRLGRATCTDPTPGCNINCGPCAFCGYVYDSQYPFKWGCVPAMDNRYRCKKNPNSGDYNGVCTGGKCV